MQLLTLPALWSVKAVLWKREGPVLFTPFCRSGQRYCHLKDDVAKFWSDYAGISFIGRVVPFYVGSKAGEEFASTNPLFCFKVSTSRRVCFQRNHVVVYVSIKSLRIVVLFLILDL